MRLAAGDSIPPAVILGTFHTALSPARSLGRKGIPVYAFDLNGKNAAGCSRYLRYLPGPKDEFELCAALIETAKWLGQPPVLYVTADSYLDFLARFQEQLKDYYFFFPLRPTVEGRLFSKRGMEQAFAQIGAARPRTWLIEQNWPLSVDEISFPAILKPDFHDRWLTNAGFLSRFGYRKVLVVQSRAELNELLPQLLPLDALVVQERIPGPSSNLFYFIGLRAKNGRMLVSFVGRKLRTYPELLGSETMLEPVKNAAVREAAEDLFRRLDYCGVAGIDFKFDARSGEFKVIEINCRFGLSDGLVSAAGIDLPYLYYEELLGRCPARAWDYRTDVRWYWLEPNIDWLREHQSKPRLSMRSLLKDSLRYKYEYLIYAHDDLGPAIHEFKRLAPRLFGRLRLQTSKGFQQSFC